MDESSKKLLDQLDILMIALNDVPSFKEKTPKTIRLKQEIAKLAKVRSKFRTEILADFVVAAPDMGKSLIEEIQERREERKAFWDKFDRMMNDEHRH